MVAEMAGYIMSGEMLGEVKLQKSLVFGEMVVYGRLKAFVGEPQTQVHVKLHGQNWETQHRDCIADQPLMTQALGSGSMSEW